MLNFEKLKPQIAAIAKIIKIVNHALSSKGINEIDYGMAQRTPYKGMTLAIIRLHQNRLANYDIDNKIAALLKDVEIEDWEDIFDTSLPMELQSVFAFAYSQGLQKSKLAEKRRGKNMTQAKLAAIVGTTQKDISRWEAGLVNPSSISLKKLANALECSVDEII